ncbi:MAG: recombination regulator RecX [Prevotella sp.]|nr:recombination regulator RecX [Prevotella sp.]MCM1074251.1 recombination regulator RecX [Ruminococcus sp.]
MKQSFDNKKRKTPAVWSQTKALEALAGLCAKSEQCEADLRLKMKQHAVSESDADSVIDRLIELNFLNEDRFAKAYTHDKVRFSGWGRLKVAIMLRSKRLPRFVIDEALAAIDEDEYREVLHKLVRTALRSLDAHNFADRQKLLRRLYSRGFEPELIRRAIDDVLNEE